MEIISRAYYPIHIGGSMFLEDLFDLDNLTMSEEDSDWVSKALKEAGIRLVEFSVLDLLYRDEAMLMLAIHSGDPAMIYLAVNHLMTLRILHGDRESWVKFAQSCLAYRDCLPH